MCGGTSTSTSTVSIPPEVLARYNVSNAVAERAAGLQTRPRLDSEGNQVKDSSGNPIMDVTGIGQYQPYTGEFVAPVNAQQTAAIQNINQAQSYAQPYIQSAAAGVQAGLGAGTNLMGESLGTIGQAAQQGAAGYGQSLGTVGTGSDQSRALYNQALSTLGSTAGQATNQLGGVYADINQATGTGQQYANVARQNIMGAQGAAAPLVQQGVGLTGQALGTGQQYAGLAGGYLQGGTQNVNAAQFGQNAVNQFMSPYMADVVQAQQALMNQQNAQQRSQLQGSAIASGAFGGDRERIAQANLAQQQGLANQAALSNLLQQGYGQALGAFQQQQGVNLAAEQANRAAQQFGAQQAAALGQQQYGQQIGAGQNLANIGQQLYGQQMGTGQAMAGLGQQQYAQGLGSAQAQAGLINQRYGMGAAQAGLQQQVGASTFGQAAQQAALQQQAAQGTFAQQAQQAAMQQQAAQNLFNMGQQGAMNIANLGLQGQQAALQGAQAQLGAGQLQQQTQQALDQAQYNQFLQQQGYPFQVAQFLANIAMGTGALSGSTTTTTQPSSFFSDRRLKEGVRRIGETDEGMPIYKFRYKGDPKEQTHIGFMADEVEKKHPEAVGEYGGYKTVDYDAATRKGRYSGGLVNAEGGAVTADMAGEGFADGGLAGSDYLSKILEAQARMYTPYGGPGSSAYGASGTPGGKGLGVVPAASLPVAQLRTAAAPTAQSKSGLGQAVGDVNQLLDAYKGLKGLNETRKEISGGLGKYFGSASNEADGGAVDRYARGGDVPETEDVEPYGAPSYVPSKKVPVRGLMTAQNPTGSKGSGLGDLIGAASAAKGLYGLGTDIASGLGSLSSFLPMLFLSSGGVAGHREHHADGTAVGTDDAQYAGLDPEFRDKLMLMQADLMDRGVPTKVISGARSPEKQSQLYAQGRTAPGPVVTNAPPGSSLHNYGRAADLAPLESGQREAMYAGMKETAPEGGLTWGGSLKSLYDPAHVQMGNMSEVRRAGLAPIEGGRQAASKEEPSAVSSGLGAITDAASGIGDWFDRNQKWLIPLMSGLGGMGSSQSRFFGGALLQGLGSAGQAYAGLQKQQSEIAKNSLGLLSEMFTPIQSMPGYYRNNFNGQVYSAEERGALARQLPGLKSIAETSTGAAKPLPKIEPAKPTLEGGTKPTTPTMAPDATPVKPGEKKVEDVSPESVITTQPKGNAPEAVSRSPVPAALFEDAANDTNPVFLAARAKQNRAQAAQIQAGIAGGYQNPRGEAALADITRLNELAQRDEDQANKIMSGQVKVRDKSGNLLESANSAIQNYNNDVAAKEKVSTGRAEAKIEYGKTAQQFVPEYSAQNATINSLIRLYQNIDLNAPEARENEAIGIAQAIGRYLGVDITSNFMKAYRDAGGMASKESIIQAMDKVASEKLQRAPAASLRTAIMAVAEPNKSAGAKFDILTKAKANLERQKDVYQDWVENNYPDPMKHELEWTKPDRSEDAYWKRIAGSTKPFAGMGPDSKRTVTYAPQEGSSAPSGTAENPVQVKTRQDVEKLPSGSVFVDPNTGKLKRVP